MTQQTHGEINAPTIVDKIEHQSIATIKSRYSRPDLMVEIRDLMGVLHGAASAEVVTSPETPKDLDREAN